MAIPNERFEIIVHFVLVILFFLKNKILKLTQASVELESEGYQTKAGNGKQNRWMTDQDIQVMLTRWRPSKKFAPGKLEKPATKNMIINEKLIILYKLLL